MPDPYKRLKQRHNYTKQGNSCKKCIHYKKDIEIETDVVANICAVDFDYNLPENEQIVHIMPMAYGICDEYEEPEKYV